MTTTWTTVEERIVWTATEDPSYQFVTLRPTSVTLTGGGGGGGLALGETSSTAYRGDRGKTAYDHSQVVTGNPHGTTAADVGADAAGTAAGLVDDLSGVSNASTARSNLGLVIGTDVQAHDADLDTLAGLTATTDSFMQAKAGAWAARTIAQVKTDLGVIEKLPRTSGKVYTLGQGEAFSTTAGQFGSGASGKMAAHPVWLPAGSYDRVAMRTNAAGTATYRIGVYPNNPATMRPDGQTLILDCGTIDMSVTPGTLTATVTLTIPTSDIYWLAILMDAYTSAPNCCGWNGNTGVVPNLPWLGHISTGYNGRGDWGCINSSVTTGAMPTTYPTSTANDIMPQVSVRAT